MIIFENRSDLNHYYYQLFRTLSDSRMHLSKKLLKQIEKDIYDEYTFNNKLMQYNEKFILKMKFRELFLNRKMMKKDFRYYKKSFNIEYKKIKPDVSVSIDKKPINLSIGKLPKIKYTSSVIGSIMWDTYILAPGVNSYSWTFVPKDNKYAQVNGLLDVCVLDDIDTNKEN